jgi:adenylate cyclase
LAARPKLWIASYVERNFEQLFILLLLLAALVINFFITAKLTFLSFYFLPIIAGGYFLGRRKAILGAVLSVLYVFLYAVYSPEVFLEKNTTFDVYTHIALWGGFLILAGAVVGELQERLKAKELEAVAESIKTREHLEATLNIATDLSSELKLSPLLHKIIAAVTKMLNAERSTLFLNDEKTNELYTEVGEGLGRTQIRMPNSLGVAGASFTTAQPIVLQDPQTDARFNAEIDRETGFQTRSLLCVPVINRQGKTIGVTEVLNKTNGVFTDADISRLRGFSSHISVALENSKLFEDVQNIKNYNESILESMPSGVITVDEAGIIVTCNAAACRIMRVAPADVIDKPVAEFFQPPNDWLSRRIRQVRERGGYDVTIDARMEFEGEQVSGNVTILPLIRSGEKLPSSIVMIEDITTEKRMKSTMARYMEGSIAEKLLNSTEDVLGGQSTVATILFADICDFTRMTEKLAPQETVRFLNEFFTVMVDCVKREGGGLDKFIGDALMAEFGIPLTHVDDEDRAVRAAIRMQSELSRLNRQGIARDGRRVQMRIGMNTDLVISGSIGSPTRMDYTVIGAGVNLASRLETACKEYGSDILVSEFTFNRLSGKYRAREVDRVVLYGKTEPISIFEILEHHTDKTFPNLNATLERFSEGLSYYRRRQWDKAIDAFHAALQLNPTDAASAVYVKRCEQLKEFQPPQDWDGVWFMKSK